MATLRFVYRSPASGLKHVDLAPGWKEVGRYIEGIDLAASSFKTYRKDRVAEYLDRGDQLLDDPFTPPPPRPDKNADVRPQILFTGFPSVQRASLERKAAEIGLHVVKSVTVGLSFLCAGPNAGPAKVHASREQHVFIVTEPQFHSLAATGELPDEEDRYL
ncbi:MAG: hypothetical protein Q7U97_13285 [Rhodocyclaceae bacterium]|nr:hypothetical protein [Rhodocyclaceae bacterium]